MTATLQLEQGRDVVLEMSDAESATPTSDPLVVEKELVHVGRFAKGHIQHNIGEQDLHHWHRTFGEMRSEGIEVPMPLEHTRSPEARRGTLVDVLPPRLNSRGKLALYGRVKFNSEKAKADLAASNVSIFVPAAAQSGSGKTFHRPLQHVAFTDYPVISGLEPFRPIKLSLIGDDDVTLRELATLAGVDPALTDEQQIIMALSQVVTKLKAAPPAPGAPQPAPGAPQPAPGGPPARPQMAPPQRPMGMALSGEAQPIAGSLLGMARDVRKMKIDRLLETGKVTLPVATRLRERYLNDEVLQFSHVTDDGFDAVIADHEANERVVPGGKTGPQSGVLELSRLKPENNPLIADAEARQAGRA